MAIMEDGYQTTIAFTSSLLSSASVLTLVMQEKEVTIPGVDGGEAIDVTTMRNSTWRTFAARSLKTLLAGGISVAWDPALYDEMVAMINDNQEITITLPDTATFEFWGHIKSFTPASHVEGTQPMADVEIIPTNRDGDNSNVEVAPVMTEA